MADKGWIKLNRQIMDHWLYADKPFNRSMAWIDLLLLADHKTHKSLWRGKLTEFKRGDVNLSLRELEHRWGWSRNKVRNFISDLEGDGMVTTKVTTQRTTLTIVKYDDFQVQGTTESTTEGTTEGKTEGKTEGTYLKNNKRIIKNNKKGTTTFTPYTDISDKGKSKKTTFHNMETNKYDFAKLEQQLLERDRSK